LSELSLLNSDLKSLVEESIKHLIGGSDLVVGLDILLQSRTAVPKSDSQPMNN
jgi:hypothetical protein